MSYRLDATAKTDRWIGFREWFRYGWKKYPDSLPYSVVHKNNMNHLLITWNHQKDPKALTYVQQQDNHSVSHFLGKDEIRMGHVRSSFFERILWHWTAFLIGLRGFLSAAQRPNYALLIRQSMEMAFILQLCKKENIEKVSFFHPYEIDSNVLSVLLIEKKIKVQYIPSIIPLYVHNHHLVCDDLVITSPYQLEEIKHQFSTSIFYKSLKYWSAESLDTYIAKNPNWKSPTTTSKSLAFYSHGQWLRNHLNRADNGLNLENTEETLLQILARLVNQQGFCLTIFLHPLEKKHLDISKAYFEEKLHAPFTFGNLEERSALSFQYYHWGIGALSSVIFERLLTGHKTILFQPQGYVFPLSSSGIKNIALFSEGDIWEFIEKYQLDSAEQFFEKNNLSDYFHFPESK
ncbi:MAG: hypothetical protein FJX95_03555 [Bacteroidetes bacterium]|nr:hypothetical protein [Bacteroidota bacterium]